jgi:chromosome segregation and condensation protein ScpB
MEKEQQRREHKNLIKAALFASGKAMGMEELAAALGISSIGYLKQLLGELVEECRTSDDPFSVVLAGSRYELALKEPYAGRVNQLAGKPDITRGSLRILAYISKNEPIMQSSIVKAFGGSTYDHVRELADKGFISAKRFGRTRRLATTSRFREYFSLGA